MRCLLLALGLAAVFSSNACAPRVSRPGPKLGQVADVHTKPGRYDGYAVQFEFELVDRMAGHRGYVFLTGQGRKTWSVREVSARDSLERRLAPTLRMDSPVMMGPAVSREPDLLGRRIEGLDYEFMLRQGWLFERCAADSGDDCELNGQYLKTSSFHAVDGLIAYLGRWLKEGDYAGSLVITVVQDQGGPEDVKTRMGAHDGYTVERCKRYADSRLIVLTGQGSQAFTPSVAGEPEDIARRGNLGVLVGRPGEQGFAILGKPGCQAPYAVYVDVASFDQVDAAISSWGRRLKDGDHKGEVVIVVPVLSEAGAL
ncbi:hypothetical protein HUA74_10060 [Myxococcus sp. CA051A]|uniref:hypothetical protein n=1 Tax=Myxococcus sp. CA051A TaxID=2741739 RepID=UPI00157B596E|nr:hypothetical protein [Myxococcus sp. CA051A]NTX61004.1 hypothetical protein [Myxococcus sp. CA051A]